MKLITTDAYLLLIDEGVEIKEGDYTYKKLDNGVIYEEDIWRVEKNTVASNYPNIVKDYRDKIIAYYPLTKETKEIDLPLLPNPFREESKFYDKLKESPYKENPGLVYYFIEGYKAAQSHSKQFSLEDVKKAIEMARETYLEADPEGKNEEWIGYTEEQIIQSLSTQQLPKEFIPEYYTNGDMIVKNREGIRELVGTYKW